MEIAGIKLDIDTEALDTQPGCYGPYVKVAERGEDGAYISVFPAQEMIHNPKNPNGMIPALGFWVRIRLQGEPWAGFAAVDHQYGCQTRVKKFYPVCVSDKGTGELVKLGEAWVEEFTAALKSAVKKSQGKMSLRGAKLTEIIASGLNRIEVMPPRTKVYKTPDFEADECTWGPKHKAPHGPDSKNGE